MPINQAITSNAFTVGTELQAVIITGSNFSESLQSLGHVEDFSATMQQTPITVIPITGGGTPIERSIYHGWHGRIMFTRFSGAITAMALGIINNFANNGVETYFQVSALVYNAMAQTSDVYVFTNAVFDSIGFGDFSSTKQVNQELNFRAQALTYTGVLSGFAGVIGTAPPIVAGNYYPGLNAPGH